MSYERAFDARVLKEQIGFWNLGAISGGRIQVLQEDGETVEVRLPVSNGYFVQITLAANDTYTVSRVFKRSGKLINKGTVEGVYFDEVGEVAYQASCFRNVSFGKVTEEAK
jgi:hypothetical protein